MSENTTASTELTSQYAAQVTSDLERNLKEQERVSGELAALQEQLTTLQHDHTVLMNMQQALGITLHPDKPASAPEQAAVPAPRKKAATRSSGTARATKSSAAPSRSRTRKSAGKAPVAATTTTQPSLVDLIRQHLTEQSEPRSTAEVAAALDQAHPDRGIKNTVVRTTLENLVAKGKAQRTKQGNSVYYIAPDTRRSTPSSPTESQQQEEAQPEAQ
ncbi:BlaI/MecI/CopY family transcriptional regulator [Streptomyces sp. NPDC001492]